MCACVFLSAQLLSIAVQDKHEPASRQSPGIFEIAYLGITIVSFQPPGPAFKEEGEDRKEQEQEEP